MSSVDLAELQAWYRNALGDRASELERLRPRVAPGGDEDARRAVRRIGRALRGSGGSFGFPQVSDAGGLLEDVAEAGLLRLVDGVADLLRRLHEGRAVEDARPRRWLVRCAGLTSVADLPADLGRAWDHVASVAEMDGGELAERVADHYGLSAVGPDDRPTRAALRLVPERLVRDHAAVPLREDGVAIEVAVANPTDTVLEAELRRLTGREVTYRVAAPARLAALLDDASLAGEGRPAAVRREPAAPGGPARILVADDDTTHRVVARATLERIGMSVTEAVDGPGALAAFDEAPVDLVVVDLDMPNMTGREVVVALRAPPRSSSVPVIVVTGASDPLLEADLIEAGADDYIRKPIDPRLFLARVTATLRRAGA